MTEQQRHAREFKELAAKASDKAARLAHDPLMAEIAEDIARGAAQAADDAVRGQQS
jgi:hypothetical protein